MRRRSPSPWSLLRPGHYFAPLRRPRTTSWSHRRYRLPDLPKQLTGLDYTNIVGTHYAVMTGWQGEALDYAKAMGATVANGKVFCYRDERAIQQYDEELLNKPRWLVLNKLDVVPEGERKKVVKDFVKKMAWKGPVFEISALNREGCEDLVHAIYQYLEAKRHSEHRSEETQMTEEARAISSIDPDDPRFKILED